MPFQDPQRTIQMDKELEYNKSLDIKASDAKHPFSI